jgi:membrane protease YdiL (CAAX protease family)
MRISFLEIAFLLYCILHCVFAIVLARPRQSRQSSASPSKKSYAPAVVMTAFPAALALLTALTCEIPVFGSSRIDNKSLLLGLAFLVLVLCLDPLEWKFTPAENRKRMTSFLPRTARERSSWVFFSIATGVGEEIIYRAVLFGILFRITGDYWTAAAASAVLFALVHFSQGLLALVSLFFVALCLQWLVKISGGLYVAIGVHFMHNFINGILWGMLTRPEGDTTYGGMSGNAHTDAAEGKP